MQGSVVAYSAVDVMMMYNAKQVSINPNWILLQNLE